MANRPRAGTSAAADAIIVSGAREHNLKNLEVAIPRGLFVVVTGVSGSGKSTLAFDVLFAEGQRRFLASMSAYAQQFVGQMARPDVDRIEGLPPTVSIEQRVSRGGGRSTVATVTEIHHFFRLLYSKLGTAYCPECRIPVGGQTQDQLIRGIREEWVKRRSLALLAPVVRNRKGFHSDVAEWAARHGYGELRADGRLCAADGKFKLDRFREHDVEVVTGRLDARSFSSSAQTADTSRKIEECLRVGHGMLFALDPRGRVSIHSTERACPKCRRSYPQLDPKMFSYNSVQGWCKTCRGFGELFYLPDVDRGARAGDIEESWFDWQEGEREPCPECRGARLNSLALAVRLDLGGRFEGKGTAPTIETLGSATVAQADAYFKSLVLHGRAGQVARDILPEVRERLKFLRQLGLDYLELGRGVTTLSGGESQRIRLAAQLGSNLSGVLYVLDEPTIGLHARDNDRLLVALEALRARGNSLLVVEHDEETMRRADWIIDLGPGAGVHGGEVVASGTLAQLLQSSQSLTGQCLRASPSFPARGARRKVEFRTGRRDGHGWAKLTRARLHNLRNLNVRIPLGRFVVVTGVSGSGKSTLVRDCLLPLLRAASSRRRDKVAGAAGELKLAGPGIKAVHEVDQSPIGRTPRSIPATYVGFFDEIRGLYARTPDARMRGYSAARFSFNSPHGRCPSCQGAGTVKLEMNFLPPAFIVCEDCRGLRYGHDTLDIQWSGHNIAQVLDMSVAEALEVFGPFPRIRRPLEALRDTGLEYVKLGQISPTLSGGEAQRLKLVTHLLTGLREPAEAGPREASSARAGSGPRNVFILEEPTIGLHASDVRRLVEVLQRLVDAGHTVLAIEHNLEFIAEADWVIDLGPEAGADGGRLVGEGTPEEIAGNIRSHTGRFLRKILSPE